jgi:uncharacterized protein YciI
MSEEEQAVMGHHIAYWQQLAERGTALVLGPVSDPAGAWGLAVVEAEKTILAVLFTVVVLAPAGWATHERITEARIAGIERRLEENYRRDRVRARRAEVWRWKLVLSLGQAHEENRRLWVRENSRWRTTLYCIRYVNTTIRWTPESEGWTGETMETRERVAVIRSPSMGERDDARRCRVFREQTGGW